MPKTKLLGVFAHRKDNTRRIIRGRMAAAGLRSGDLEKRGVLNRRTYYSRLNEAGDIRLKEIWGMEAAGVRFTDEDLLAMFGRSEQI